MTMLHFVHVFTPETDRKAGLDEQKAFFGPDGIAEADDRRVAARRDDGPERQDEADGAVTSTRFVALLSPPFL
jgi:hypothetical protein